MQYFGLMFTQQYGLKQTFGATAVAVSISWLFDAACAVVIANYCLLFILADVS